MADYDVRERLREKLFSVFRDAQEINWLLDTIAVPLQSTVDILEDMLSRNGFDDWEGVQLENKASKIGVKRGPKQEPFESLFTLVDEDFTEDPNNSMGFSDDNYPSEGGYFADETGLDDVDNPEAMQSDEELRQLCKQKASALKTKATVENLFLYLVAFGARCFIRDDETMKIVYDPVDFYALNDWQKWHAVTKGFKPAGISVSWRDMMRNGDEI
jgi:hypothetical protein